MPLTPKIEITKAILSKYQPSPQKNIEVYEITEPRLVRGSNVILQCVARRGYPRAVFKWFKDGERIRAETKELFNRSKLKLKNIQRSDEGTYKCFASNIMGEHETTTELRLESKYAKYRKPADCGRVIISNTMIASFSFVLNANHISSSIMVLQTNTGQISNFSLINMHEQTSNSQKNSKQC